MSQRFVIDININGAQGAATQGRAGQDTGIGAAAVGAFTGSRGIVSGRRPEGIKDMLLGDLDPYRDSESYTKDRFSELKKFGLENTPGGLSRLGTRRAQGVSGYSGWYKDQLMTETTFGAATRGIGNYVIEHQKQLKALGVAAAWKATNTAIDLKNYKSGDSYNNQQRNNAMKMATYTTVMAATGFNPIAIAAMIGNEAISALSDYQKYSFDRKMESQQIFNIKQIAGDVSYGINRRGGY